MVIIVITSDEGKYFLVAIVINDRENDNYGCHYGCLMSDAYHLNHEVQQKGLQALSP